MSYDLIVVGAGPGGYPAAIRAAQEGMRVALIEQGDVGGTCLNRGCIPTKTLLHSADLYHEMTHAEQFGVKADRVSYDLSAFYSRKDDVTAQLRGGVEALIGANGITLLRGEATLSGNGSVTIGEQTIEGKNILIATGSVPAVPPIPGMNLPGVMTSDELLSGPHDFQRLTIIGGGVIGVEFAGIFASLGCEVTILEGMSRILPSLDREISQSLGMLFKKRGITVHAGAMVEEITSENGNMTCRFRKKEEFLSTESDAVLVCVGRRSNLTGLGAPEEWARGIPVDEFGRTSLPGVYAVGDVVQGGIQLAHAATAQGLRAVAHMLGKAEASSMVVPSCIYTNPEIACVGLTADEANEQGIAVKTSKASLSANGKSIIAAQERSFIKLVFSADTEVLLGAQMMCARATDMIDALTTAITNGLTAAQLEAVIRPHPTFCEAVAEAVEALHDRAIHSAPKRR